jgi:hypothetical protein
MHVTIGLELMDETSKVGFSRAMHESAGLER